MSEFENMTNGELVDGCLKVFEAKSDSALARYFNTSKQSTYQLRNATPKNMLINNIAKALLIELQDCKAKIAEHGKG